MYRAGLILVFTLAGLVCQAQIDSTSTKGNNAVLTWLKSESVKKEAPICAMLFLAGAADGVVTRFVVSLQ